MSGPDQITVPVRIGTVVRDFGPMFMWSGPWSEDKWSVVRGPNYGPEFWSEIKWSGPWSEIFGPILNGPVRSEVLVRIFRTGP